VVEKKGKQTCAVDHPLNSLLEEKKANFLAQQTAGSFLNLDKNADKTSVKPL
jgi:hypothetical protein